jgi:pyridoxine 4-dehydrogenase
MSHSVSASAAGQFKIGGDITVNRLGYGAMRITGKGIWGEPANRPAALATLKRSRNSTSISSIRPIPMARMSAKT